MLGYQFVKLHGNCLPPDPALMLCEGANGWVILCETKDALTEVEARREAAEDLVKELQLLFPDAVPACRGLASFKSYDGALRAADYVANSWGVRPEVHVGLHRTFYMDWPACSAPSSH